MKAFFCYTLILFSISVCTAQTREKLSVNRLFSDHMVLQQQENIGIWGHCPPGSKVIILANWGAQTSTAGDADGNWKTKLTTPKAGGPYSVKIEMAGNSIVISDVMIGEVWLASGQSNMDINLQGWLPDDTIRNSRQEIADANYPDIRLLKVPFNISTAPLDSFGGGKWTPASPETAGDFSATAYFYAKKLYQELHVPIGIIQSSIGGTPAEAWTSKESLTRLGDFNKTIEGLATLQSTINTWFKERPFRSVPRTDVEWENLQLSDKDASQTNFDDSSWETKRFPGRFDQLSSGEFDGVMWIRRTFVVQDTSSDYLLRIGSVDDMDETYINGTKVGGLMGGGFATTLREMAVPKKLLNKGSNTITIRVIDTGGPGFVNGPITLSDNRGNTISLEGDWKTRLIAENISGRLYTYNFQTNISRRPNISLLNSNTPTVLYNAMIHPIVPYTIKGAIWYQGESNVGRDEQYKYLFPAMIKDWRSKWGFDFPFYYVQIAPYLYSAPDQKNQSQKLRNAQRYALKLPKTGMVVTLDIGKLTTAHPSQKLEVGERLARFALANEYGKKLVTSGPLYKNTSREGDKLVIEFDPTSVGSGLVASGAKLTGFEIAGSDKLYISAKAIIKNNKVVVSDSSIVAPVYVRYAWSDGFSATLFNKEGLPASTFTSEE